MYVFEEDEQRKASPEALLNRMLSTKAYLAKSSAADDKTHRTCVSIGEGMCGTVFALNAADVIKVPKSPEKLQQLHQDAIMHKSVQEAFRRIPSSLRQDINVPEFHGWVSPKSDSFWDTKAQDFPSGSKVPNYDLISIRILPLQLPVRAAIIDALCSKSIRKLKKTILEKPENKDCLVRLYLGRRNDDIKGETARLRNFPLHVNEMEGLKLDTGWYAVTMARALAVTHWAADMDANDVEFVLGSSPANNKTAHPTSQELEACDKDSAGKLYHWDFDHRSISIQLLDFNQCKTFEHDSQGLKQLVDSFWWNDPYYPRPGSKNENDKNLWEIFKKAYLEASDELSGGTIAKDFIDAVEKSSAKRSGGGLFAN
jgi:hypothetical protein